MLQVFTSISLSSLADYVLSLSFPQHFGLGEYFLHFVTAGLSCPINIAEHQIKLVKFNISDTFVLLVMKCNSTG